MKQITQFIKEITPVLLGVLMALVINNWNEDRKEKKYLKKIFSSIEKELEESVADIKRVIPKQQRLMDSLEVYNDNETITLINVVVGANGISHPSIKTNTWKAIASSKIELIDYEKLSALSDIEERKENLARRTEKVIDFVFENYEETDKGKKIAQIHDFRYN